MALQRNNMILGWLTLIGISVLLNSCSLNEPGIDESGSEGLPSDIDPSPSSTPNPNLGVALIEIAGSKTTINADDQSRVAVHVQCPANVASGLVTQTSTAFTCSGNNWDTNLELNLSSFAEGAFILTANFSNAQSVSTEWLTKDTLAPQVSSMVLQLSSGTSKLYSTPDIDFSSATDGGSGVQSYQARIIKSGGQIVADWSNIAPNAHLGSLSLIHGQSYYFELRAQDNADNFSNTLTSASWIAEKPIIAILQMQNSGVVDSINQFAYNISGSCNDNGGAVQIKVSDGVHADVQKNLICTSHSWSALMDLSSLNTGSLSVNAQFSDIAGNAATAATNTLSKP